MNWLRDEKRADGPQGFMPLCGISARMSEALQEAILAVPEEAWEPYGEPHPEEIRECAEVPVVPREKSEHKQTKPLSRLAGWGFGFAGGRGLFEGGPATRYLALLSNIWGWKAGRLMEWYREKAGTIEAVHDVVKNELAGRVLPSKYLGANAAWRRPAVIAHNVLRARKRLALPAELLRARPTVAAPTAS